MVRATMEQAALEAWRKRGVDSRHSARRLSYRLVRMCHALPPGEKEATTSWPCGSEPVLLRRRHLAASAMQLSPKSSGSGREW